MKAFGILFAALALAATARADCDFDSDPKIAAWFDEFGTALQDIQTAPAFGDTYRINPSTLQRKAAERLGIPHSAVEGWENHFNAKPPAFGWTFKDEGALFDSTGKIYQDAFSAYGEANGKCRMKKSESKKWIGDFVRKFGKEAIVAHISDVNALTLAFYFETQLKCLEPTYERVLRAEADFKKVAEAYWGSFLDYVRTLTPENQKPLAKGIRFVDGYLRTTKQSSVSCFGGRRLTDLRFMARASRVPEAMAKDLRARLVHEKNFDPTFVRRELYRKLGLETLDPPAPNAPETAPNPPVPLGKGKRI